jgi:hypothetical protein
LDVKREYPRDVVEAAGHNRFVKLLPEELTSFECRVLTRTPRDVASTRCIERPPIRNSAAPTSGDQNGRCHNLLY